ncbi:MAG TPA: hypothetical protein VF164_09720 [Trueperaceae bacterium]
MSNHQATHHRSNAPKNPDQDEAIADRLTQGQAVTLRCPRCRHAVIATGAVTCFPCAQPMRDVRDREGTRQ